MPKHGGLRNIQIISTGVLDKDITTVHICTPPTLHYEMVKKVILAGKHVICEKPFCLKASEARELLELSKERVP